MVGQVTGNQERYLLAERFTAASYQAPYVFHLRGPLDVERLRRAVDDTVAAHDILRTCFFAEGAGFGSRPDPVAPTLQVIDASGLSTTATDAQCNIATEYKLFYRTTTAGCSSALPDPSPPATPP